MMESNREISHIGDRLPEKQFDEIFIPFDPTQRRESINLIEALNPGSFRSPALAKHTTITSLLSRGQEHESLFFIGAEQTKVKNIGKGKSVMFPEIQVGILDTESIFNNDWLSQGSTRTLLLPTLQHFDVSSFDPANENPSKITSVNIRKLDKQEFKPFIYFGSRDEMLDLITDPIYSTGRSFDAELFLMFGLDRDPSTEEYNNLNKLRGDIFEIISFSRRGWAS